MSANIFFKLFFSEQEISITTYYGEYNNLMELIFDKLYLDDFGECRGMGKCGTCLVSMDYNIDMLSELERNEGVTLTKMGILDPSVRLSCQIFIDDKLTNSLISIL